MKKSKKINKVTCIKKKLESTIKNDNKFRTRLNKVLNYIKNLFKSFAFIIVIGVIAVIGAVIAVMNNRKPKFVLDKIYDVFPEEVRSLYANLIDVSCYGDMYFSMGVGNGEVLVANLDKGKLMDYTFSYLDKNKLLTDKMDKDDFTDANDVLLANYLDLSGYLDGYSYGEYIYSVGKSGKVSREKTTCNNTIKHVSRLQGYSYNDKSLSVDVNVGYSIDGILYDITNKKLGKYSGDIAELKLLDKSPYYRYNFVLNNKKYKLYSIEVLSKM